jgi:translin
LDNLESISEQIRKSLSAKDEAREKMLPLCRDSIRYSSNAIRAVHRQEFKLAEELAKTARSILNDAEKAVLDNGELGNAGLIRDAQKELAEANITLAIVTGKPLPEPDGLGVDAAAYLNGLGEAAGELRRYLLDGMRQGDLSRGEELLSAMDNIYGVLVTMDYPDAITGGLRRTTDMVRGVLERTRSDLTLGMRLKDLESRLQGVKQEDISSVRQDEEVQFEEPVQQGEPVLDESQIIIYEELSKWREHKASEENLSPYVIARNSWLKEIIKLQPSTPKDLMVIKGFGERRANKYGKDIINIIRKSR